MKIFHGPHETEQPINLKGSKRQRNKILQDKISISQNVDHHYKTKECSCLILN